jgi:murein DD-endopeptidase MepM/ murein hydrolase activator NlpD
VYLSKEKITEGQIAKLLCFLGMGVTALVFILLLTEYRALNTTAEQVLTLKEEYRSYVMALKRALREKTRDTDKDEKTDVKKNSIIDENDKDFKSFSAQSEVALAKTDTTFSPLQPLVDSEYPQETFLVVNRDPRYLRAGAVEFAKQYNMDQVLAKMFDTQQWQEQAHKKKVKMVRRRRQGGRKRVIQGTSSRPVVFEEAPRIAKADRDFLFSSPVERSKYWLSSPFGPRKIGKNAWKFHYGIDMACPRGTPVQAAASGIVLESYYHNGFGNCIVILHNHKYKTRYAHLHARYVKAGQEVARGKVIGSVGATGAVRSRGNDASHLHFEVYAYGRRVNPLSVLM